MRYKPVEIKHLTVLKFVRQGRKIIPLEHTARSFFQACGRSCSCGHRHRTEKAAEPCLNRLKKQWSRRRSELSRRAARKRWAA